MNGLFIVALLIIVCGGVWVRLRKKTAPVKRRDHSRGKRSGLREESEKPGKGAKKPASLSHLRPLQRQAAQKVKNSNSQDTLRRVSILPLLTIIATVTGGVIIILLLLNSFFSSPAPEPVKVQETRDADILTMYSTAGEILADYLTETYQGGKILVLMPPAHQMTDGDEAVLDSLKDNSGDEIVFDVHQLGQDDEEGKESAEEEKPWFSADVFDREISEIADKNTYSAVVSVAGLPARPEKVKFWHRRQSPDMLLINAPLYRLGRLIREGYIKAVLVRRPVIAVDASPVDFSDREKWLLVTADNLTEIKERYKGIIL